VNGWSCIFAASIVTLFILWCLRGWIRMKSSSDITLNNFMEQLWMVSTAPPLSAPLSVRPPPQPSASKGETECKRFLEFYFQKPFQKIRPEFLTNPITNSPLELDMYNEELRLAVEYNGAQHYNFNRMMHNNSRDKFQNQQYRDYIKKNICKDLGIDLIIVPYTVPNDKIGEFLMTELHKRGYRAAGA
jgi:hypothetical protein